MKPPARPLKLAEGASAKPNENFDFPTTPLQRSAIGSAGLRRRLERHVRQQQNFSALYPNGSEAESVPGFSLQEDNFLTFLPNIDRYVVAASVDWPECHIALDGAIGHFPTRSDPLLSARAGRSMEEVANLRTVAPVPTSFTGDFTLRKQRSGSASQLAEKIPL